MQGAQEATLTADADLAATTVRQAWSRPPIELDFSGMPSQLPEGTINPELTGTVVMFTASGLLVRYLKVFEKSGYNSVKWVRYLSKANGSYQIRVCVSRRPLHWPTVTSTLSPSCGHRSGVC